MAGRILLDIGPSLDANGAVDSGSVRTYYENGTTTLQSIYADADLTTPLANPLACDAAGQFPVVWAQDDHAYTVIWQLSDGTIRSFDNISTLGSGSSIDDHGIVYKVDATGSRTMLHLDLAACVGFSPSNTGASNGDALRAAFDALGSANVPVNGVPGTYPCAGSIKLPQVPIFEANGMVLDFQGQDGDYDTSLVPAGYCVAVAGSATALPSLAHPAVRQPPNTNNICLSQAVAGAGNLTLNGSAVSSGVATLDQQGNIVQFDFSALTAGSVTMLITGKTPGGAAQTDTVTVPASGGLSLTSIYLWGTVTSIAASAAITGNVTVGVTSNVQQITLSGDVPDTVTRGSFIRLVDQTVLYNGARPEYYIGEDAIVHSVTGRTIRFVSTLKFSGYTTAGTFVNLMNYARTVVEGLVVHGRGNGTSQNEVALLAYMCGPYSALNECYGDFSDYNGIQLAFCNGIAAVNCTGMKLTPGLSRYGLAIANSCNVRVIGGQYASAWTAITQGDYASIYGIVNFNNIVDGATGSVVAGGGANQSAAFDTHGNSLECGYVNCTAYGFVTFAGSKTFYRNCYIRAGSGRGLPNYSIFGSELLTTEHEIDCVVDYLGGGINSGYGVILDCGGTGSSITSSTTGGGDLTIKLKVRSQIQFANSVAQVRNIVIRNRGSSNPTTNPMSLDFSDSSFQLREAIDANVTNAGSFLILNDNSPSSPNFKLLNLTNVTGAYTADIRGVDAVVGVGLVQDGRGCGSAAGDGIKITNPLSVALSSVIGLGGAAGLVNITGTTAGAPIATLSGISAAAGVYGSTELTVQAGSGAGAGGIATVTGCAFADPGHTNISLGNLLFAAMTQNNVAAGGFSNSAANKGSGTGTIASGNTSVVVTHSGAGVFGTAPTRYSAQQTAATTNACYITQIDTVTATQMTVHCNADPGASGLAFRWQVQA